MKKLITATIMTIALLIGVSMEEAAAADTYTVKKGDTLYRIALTHDISVAQLKNWNDLSSNLIYPGQTFDVSGGSSSVAAESTKQSDEKSAREMTVTATAYTANCSGCSGVTATGINLKANPNKKVISVDPDVIPLGTKVHVEGYGTAVAGDTGGAIRGNKIDVFFPSRSDALQWGRKEVKIKVLN